MEQTVKFRKDEANLSNKLGPKKPKPFKRRNKLKFKQTRDGSETGERTGTDRQAEKDESSEKSYQVSAKYPGNQEGQCSGEKQ